MQNAKKGDKVNVVPLYYLIDENRELHFEITKVSKEKYDKYIEKEKRYYEEIKKKQDKKV